MDIAWLSHLWESGADRHLLIIMINIQLHGSHIVMAAMITFDL